LRRLSTVRNGNYRGSPVFIRSVIITAIIGLCVCTGVLSASETPTDELYAVRHGSSTFPLAYIFEGDTVGKSVPFDWLFYVIKTHGRVILVDTGFSDTASARKFGVTLDNPVDDLAVIGVDSDSVTDIIITHTHFDHAGNIKRYTNAIIYVQRSELRELKKYAASDAKIIAFDKSFDIDNVIRVEHIGGHTNGSCVVWITFQNAHVLLTGDEAYLPANISQQKPIGTKYNRNKNIAFLRRAASSGSTCRTFHDQGIVPRGKKIVRLYP